MACKSHISGGYIYRCCNKGNRLSLLRKRRDKSCIERTREDNPSYSWRRDGLNSGNSREGEGWHSDDCDRLRNLF